MKQIKLVALLIVSAMVLTSCCKDEDTKPCKGTNTTQEQTNAKTVTLKTSVIGHYYNVIDQKGDWIKFSFKEGKVVKGDDWDFAIRGRAIITNGKGKAQQQYVFAKNEPKRTKSVKVASVLQKFNAIKSAGEGFVTTSWFSDLGNDWTYSQAETTYVATSPAILFLPENKKASTEYRQSWYTTLFGSEQGSAEFTLRPVVFVFQTQDGHFAKMTMEKMDRTYNSVDKKEDITYTIKYYYNPKKGSPSLDATK